VDLVAYFKGFASLILAFNGIRSYYVKAYAEEVATGQVEGQ
jgi:hypothetical protein